MVFIFAGIAWAALTRRARSVQHPNPEKNASPQLEREFDRNSSLDSDNDVGPRFKGLKRGVEAIFSRDEVESPQLRVARTGWMSRRLVADIVELGLLLTFYAGFVEEYSANLYFRSWLHANFPWAPYLLNYYALLTVAIIAGVLLVSLIEKQRLEARRG